MAPIRPSLFRHFGILIASVATIALAGCTTTGDKTPVARLTPNMSDIQMANHLERVMRAAGVVNEKLTDESGYYRQHPGNRISPEYSTESVKGGYEVRAAWTLEGPTAFYKPGQYLIPGGINDGGSKDFLKRTTKFLEQVANEMRQAGANVVVEAECWGQADGIPIGSAGVVYGGEFGYDVYLPASNTTLNDVKGEVRIKTGDRLSNLQLAAMRAYAVNAYVRNLAEGDLKGFSESFRATTVGDVGPRHRFAKVTMKVRVVNPNAPSS